MSIEALIEPGLKKFKQTAATKTGSAFCGAVMSDTIQMQYVGHTGCYGGLQNSSFRGSQVLFSKQMEIRNHQIMPTTDDIKLYLNYLMNESPFRDSFLWKDPQLVIDNQVSVHNPHIPANVMVLGLFAYRLIWEKPYLVKFFSDLVSSGVNPHLAYYYAQCIESYTVNNEEVFKAKPTSLGHGGFSSYALGVKSLKAFISGQLSGKLDSDTYSKKGSYGGINACVSCDTDGSSRSTHKFWEDNYIPGQQQDIATNPFSAATAAQSPERESGYESYSDLVKNIKDFTPKFLKFIGV